MPNSLILVEQHPVAHVQLIRQAGRGKVTQQYVFALVAQGKQYLLTQQSQKAIEAFKKALIYPENLGEGKLAGAQENNIYYYSGCAYASQGLVEKALECFQTASSGLEEPSNAFFYNDQPPDMIFYQGLARLQLHDHKGAQSRFHKLIDYGEQHLFDQVKINYFAA